MNATIINQAYDYMKESFNTNILLYGILAIVLIAIIINRRKSKKKVVKKVQPKIHQDVLNQGDKIEQWQANTFNAQLRMIKETGAAMTIKYNMKKQEAVKVQNEVKQIEDKLRLLKQKSLMVEKQIELMNSLNS